MEDQTKRVKDTEIVMRRKRGKERGENIKKSDAEGKTFRKRMIWR